MTMSDEQDRDAKHSLSDSEIDDLLLVLGTLKKINSIREFTPHDGARACVVRMWDVLPPEEKMKRAGMIANFLRENKGDKS